MRQVSLVITEQTTDPEVGNDHKCNLKKIVLLEKRSQATYPTTSMVNIFANKATCLKEREHKVKNKISLTNSSIYNEPRVRQAS